MRPGPEALAGLDAAWLCGAAFERRPGAPASLPATGAGRAAHRQAGRRSPVTGRKAVLENVMALHESDGDTFHRLPDLPGRGGDWERAETRPYRVHHGANGRPASEVEAPSEPERRRPRRLCIRARPTPARTPAPLSNAGPEIQSPKQHPAAPPLAQSTRFFEPFAP